MLNEPNAKQLRSFGLLVGGIFCAIGIWPLVVRGEGLRLWALILGGLFVAPSLVFPRMLGPVYRVWMAIGHILGRVNTAIILAIIFYGVITPMGVVMRMLGKDSMRRYFDSSAETYRLTKSSRPGSHMLRQF